LPALPQAWPNGAVTGLVMRGGFVVDMRWENGEVSELKIHSRLGGNLRLRSHFPLPATQGFRQKAVQGVNPNPFYVLNRIKDPLINTNKVLPILSFDKVFVVDVATESGRDYVWRSQQAD
jgi:alpha-L-fucosidase 2